MGDWERPLKKADWNKVVSIAMEALSNRTKDLQVTAWLTEALIHIEGWVGLQQGLRATHGLINTFWDTLHPALDDGDPERRIAPLAWIATRLDDAIHNIAPHRTV